MAFDAHVLRVLIASPGDTREERDAVEKALHGWNADRAGRESVILLPQRWETHAVPRLGRTGQGVINEQLVDRADIVIALFDSRLGQATTEAVSGTAEEIERATRAGKPVHVWFSDEPLPRDVDPGQLTALRAFKKRLEQLGLLGSYANPDDLAYKARQAIESDLDALNLGPVRARPTHEGAKLRAAYEFDREPEIVNGKTRMRTRHERLTVRNIGSVPAESVSIALDAGTSGRPPGFWGGESPTVIPDSSFSWPLFSSMGGSRSFRVTMNWREGNAERTEVQGISLQACGRLLQRRCACSKRP
jgi:hypothetical protein